MSPFEKLDSEHASRIHALSKSWHDGSAPKVADVFHSAPVVPSIGQPKVILGSFTLEKIYVNYPFAHRLFVILCPRCLKADEATVLRGVLSYSDVVPVLVANYADYPAPIARVVLEFPHISRHEFSFFRFARVLSLGSERVCDHCVEERRRLIVEDVKRLGLPQQVSVLVGDCIGNLHPFIDPDFELIDTLSEVVKKKDMAAFKAIVGTSEMISKLRTCQAYNSRTLLPFKDVSKLLEATSDFLPSTELEMEQIAEVVNSPLTLKVRVNINPKDFFLVANEHRKSLVSVVDGLVERATTDGGFALSKLSNQLAELNNELRSLRTNKRYLGYKAAVGFLRTNKVLVGSTLVAGALGLAGSFWGCGVTAVSGVGAKLGIRKLRKMGKLRSSSETKEFLSQLKASIRPKVHRLLASYTGASLPAVQMQEISEDVEQRLRKPHARIRPTSSGK